MTKILHRSLRSTLPFAVSARGIRFTDHEGREYIDAFGGAGVSCLGPGHPDVLAAMHAPIDHVLLAPPFIATKAGLDEIVERLAVAIETGTAALRRAA